MSPARVIGLGQAFGGDDGVGPEVLRALKAHGVPEAELHVLLDPTGIVPLLETAAPVILVDAVVGAEPGRVLDLSLEDVAGQGVCPLSTHGIGVMQAIALARTLWPGTVSERIRIVGIGVPPPPRGAHLGLSPLVAAAVPRAVRMILRLLEEMD